MACRLLGVSRLNNDAWLSTILYGLSIGLVLIVNLIDFSP